MSIQVNVSGLKMKHIIFGMWLWLLTNRSHQIGYCTKVLLWNGPADVIWLGFIATTDIMLC
jgi:hypothetical protein